MSNILFSAKQLAKRFGDRLVLQDVSFDVEAGQVHGIMGPNGAGKTTCFNVLTGRYRPDAGKVTMRGEDITGCAPRTIARHGIARSFQVMNLFDDFSALENIAVATRSMRDHGYGMWRDATQASDAYDRAAEILSRVGLAGKESARAKSLSYGERRALEIGVALAGDPTLLFLDEPTAGLGADGIARVADLVAELKRHLTLVIIEHDMRFLFALADQISVVHWGQVIARGTPAALRDNPWVRRSNLGQLTC